ncbi:MAG: hypothetical protein ACP5E3_16495, partial [Bacteroidales bacterium]
VEWVMYGLMSFILNQVMHPRLAYCIIEAEGVVDGIRTCLGAPENLSSGNYNDSAYALADTTSPETNNKSVVSLIDSNPVSSVAYFKDLNSRLKLVPEVKAQGFGFTAANPVLELWRMVRNITYFLLVIVVIAMAFMIMFRMKISPQTVISVQSALPRVVLALILITFSYAIAGFMIDLMYVVIGLLAGIIYNASFTSGENWGEIFGQLTGQWGVLDLTRIYIKFFFPALMSALFRGGMGFAILGATFIIPLIITIIVVIMLIWMTIRILWMLIKTYVNILMQIIIGPIQILVGTLTGGGFGVWLKTLIAELAVYPITGFLFFVSFIFLRSAFADRGLIWLINWFQDNVIGIPGIPDFPFGLDSAVLGGGRGWAPPLTIGSRAIELMWLAASLVILTMIPKAADIAKKFILGGRFDMRSAIGESWAAVPWAGGKVAGGIENRQTRRSMEIGRAETQAKAIKEGWPQDKKDAMEDRFKLEKAQEQLRRIRKGLKI